LINLFYTDRPEGIAKADIVILPGSKATIADLALLREKKLDDAIRAAKERDASIVGICGGYQMMGMTVSDPEGIEGKPETVEGLGLLPVDTVIGNSKVTRNVSFTSLPHSQNELSEGYEIHMGRTTLRPGASPLNVVMPGEVADGCIVGDCCFGTYIHGWLDNEAQIRMLLSRFLPDADIDFNYRRFRDEQYDRLAEMLRENLNIPLIYKILSRND
ncbi:MAG: cobyric acid synthase, partial [Paramuribaculum sp.]|nr:cobyric acid synthase [Paramuribaculum sp.]